MKVFYLFFVFVFSKDEHAAEQIVPRGKPDPRGKRGAPLALLSALSNFHSQTTPLRRKKKERGRKDASTHPVSPTETARKTWPRRVVCSERVSISQWPSD